MGLVDVISDMYENEPCRICGKLLPGRTVRTVRKNVFVGYSKCNKSRAAHYECYKKYPSFDGKTARAEWKYQ